MGQSDDDKSLFTDAHGFLQHVRAEMDELKSVSTRNENKRQSEIKELRDMLNRQREERKATLSRLRSEFEEFVHKKVDKVVDEVEVMKNQEHADDSLQQGQLDRISEDVEQLKQNLFFVEAAWGKLVSSCLNPDESGMRGQAFDADAMLGGMDEARRVNEHALA